jgi:hypothetical protein
VNTNDLYILKFLYDEICKVYNQLCERPRYGKYQKLVELIGEYVKQRERVKAELKIETIDLIVDRIGHLPYCRLKK